MKNAATSPIHHREALKRLYPLCRFAPEVKQGGENEVKGLIWCVLAQKEKKKERKGRRKENREEKEKREEIQKKERKENLFFYCFLFCMLFPKAEKLILVIPDFAKRFSMRDPNIIIRKE